MRKNAKFSSAGGSAPRPPEPPAAGGFVRRPPITSGSWGLCAQTHTPQLRISGYAPATLCTVYNYMGLRSFCFEQFFLHRSVANLMMLTVCLMLNCFLFEKFYLHYALCDFDSILLHCTKLFIRLSIVREQIFDVTFENPPIEKSYVHHCSISDNMNINKFFGQNFFCW